MRKSIIVLLILAVLAGIGLTSCKNEVQAPVDELVSVSFENESSRALTASLPSFDKDDYYWFYAAKKVSDTALASGQTTEYTFSAKRPVKEGATGLGVVSGFSQGLWNFKLFGCTRTGDGTELSPYVYHLVYEGEKTGVMLKSGATNPEGSHSVLVTVSPVQSSGNGKLVVVTRGEDDHVTMSLLDSNSVAVYGTDYIPRVESVKPVGGTTQYVGNTDYETAVANASTNGVFSLPAGAYVVTVVFSNPAATVNVAKASIVATVYSNLTTTIKGNLNETSTNADFIAPDERTHNYYIQSDGSWKCFGKGNHAEHTLDGTTLPYITVLNGGEPTEIIPLAENIYSSVGNGFVTVVGDSVTYTNSGAAQEVVVRTGGGTLTINAPADTVNHYGNAAVVDVNAIAGTSYHENGDVDLIKVKKGHIELEPKSDVLGVYVYNDSTDAVKDNSFEEIKITVRTEDVPQLSRSAVEIDPTNGTKVCTVVTDESKDIYLFQQGVYEQIKTVDAGEIITTHESASWADDGSRNNEKTQTAAHQLANELNASFTVGETTYTVTVNTESENRELVVTNTSTSEVVTDVTTVAEIVAGAVDQSASDGDDAVADLPLRGDGLSWETAFEVYDYATMQKINDYAGQDRYFKVVIGKTDKGHIDLDNWSYIYMDGHFDGSGVIFDNLDQTLFYGPYKSEQFDARNFTISDSASISGWRTGAAVLYVGAPVNHLSNITVHGYIQGSDRAAAFIGWGSYSFGTQKWYFDNCYSDATLVGACAGGFIAHPYNNDGSSSYCYAYAYFNDSLFEGVMQTSSNPNYINGNHSGAASGSAVYMNFTDASLLSRFNAVCKTALGTNTNENGYAYVYGQNNPSTPFNSMCDYLKRSSMETISHTLEGMSFGDSFTASKNVNATKAIITFNVGPNGTSESGNFVGTYLKDEFTSFEGETITSSVVRYYTIAVNPDGVDATGVYDTRLCIVGEQYGTTYGSASVTISQYNSNGYLIQLDVWTLPVE